MKCGSKKPARPCCFPVLKGFISTASTSLPQPAISDHHFMIFYWIQTRRATWARIEMWFENASRGPAGPCCFRFVGRLFGGWIVCEIVQNRRKTIRPKAVKFFSGFRRDVWHRGWGKCVSKMGPLGRPGHAVSLFWSVVVKVAEVFHVYTASRSLPQPALSYQNTMTIIVWASPSTGHAGGTRNFIQETLPNSRKRDRQPRAASRPIMRSIWIVLGSCWELTLETLSPVASEVASLSLRSIFFSEILRLPGTGIAKMRPEPLCWPILGLCWPICWGPCSPILRLCWGYVGPSWRHVGPCCGRGWTVGYPPRWFGAMLFSWLHRHSQNFAWKRSPQWPARHPLHFGNAISLKKLNPAGDGHTPDERLKAPTSGLRGSRSRKRGSEARGGFPVAEATIQARCQETFPRVGRGSRPIIHEVHLNRFGVL